MQIHPEQLFVGQTIRELAQQIGMHDPASLERTVSMYNACVDAKNDPEFGQLPHNLVWKCEKPPFWATTASPALHYMCGGLRTNGVTTQVVDRWNRVIPGFYAAGEITGGVHGTNRLGGNATTDCIVFGRLAGREAAS
jgi:succinate dehydrogenase/fumarate reductase flavoprotein subunit